VEIEASIPMCISEYDMFNIYVYVFDICLYSCICKGRGLNARFDRPTLLPAIAEDGGEEGGDRGKHTYVYIRI